MSFKAKLREGISNWNRFQQILRVLARHGFAGIIHELGFGVPVQSEGVDKVDEDSVPRQLRLAFEELGPTFIKLGQILSTRPDLLPSDYIDEFSKLTDRIPAFAFSEVEQILESEFGRAPSELFQSIESKPIAAASISQVHRARLKESPDTKVVVKVQRPGIHETIQSDIQILYTLAKGLEAVRKELKLLNLTAMIEEFQKSIYEELDFSLEAKNIESFSSRLGDNESIIIPRVILKCSTKKVLTMTEIEGRTLSQVREFPENIDREKLAQDTVKFFVEGMFIHGIFHCDAHAGNFILIEKGRGKLGLIDFGMVGRLDDHLRKKLARIFLDLVNRDFDSLAVSYTEVAEFGKRFSISDFRKDIQRLLAPNLSKRLSEVDVGKMMLDSVEIARKYQLRLPRELILFYRAVVTLEHIGRTLDPNFNFLKAGSGLAQVLIRHQFSSKNLSQDAFKLIDGFRSLALELPTQLRTLVYKIESEEIFPSPERFEAGFRSIRRSNQFLGLCILSLGVVLGAAVLHSVDADHPLSMVLWGTAALTFLAAIVCLFRR